jgi:OmpA-like transmembrane domain
MKKILAIALFSTTITAHAEGVFIGGDLGLVSYPDYTTDTTNWLINNGASYVATTQKVVSGSLEIHGGQWITDSLGWEIGYANLGSVTGSYTSNAFVTYPSGAYKYSASAVHVALLGGIPMGRGKLFGKFGVASASTTLDDPYFSQTVYSTALLLGGGYEFWVNPNVSLRAGLDLYSGVDFVNEGSYAIESRGMARVAVGANVTF